MKKSAERNLKVCKWFCKQAALNVCNYGPGIKFYDETDEGWCLDHDPIVVTFLTRALISYQYYRYFNQ